MPVINSIKKFALAALAIALIVSFFLIRLFHDTEYADRSIAVDASLYSWVWANANYYSRVKTAA